MDTILLPKLINAGIYDAASVHKNCTDTPKRTVSLFELELPLENGGISFIDDSKYPVSSDCLLCAKPGQTRHTRLPFQCYFVHLLVRDRILQEQLSSIPDCFRVNDREAYQKLFTGIIRAYSFPVDGNEIYLAARLLDLIDAVCRDCSEKNTIKRSGNPLIAEALNFMDNNFSKNIRLSDIAHSLNISPVYFHRIFSQITGQTPYQYLLHKKLDAAKKLLITTALPLSDIAFSVGFTSQSYFGYVFKKELGITPLQYRKNTYNHYPG